MSRAHDLYAAIALPASASTREARRAARDMRRSATGERLEAACVAEVVLGDARHRRAYDELRARAAAAGVALPEIGAAMPASPLPPPPLRGILAATGRVLFTVLQIVAALVAIFLFALCMAEHAPTKQRYEPPKIPEYRYRPPPDYYQYKVPDYRLPKIEVPPMKP